MKVKVYGDKIDLADELQEEFHAEAKDVIGEAGTMLTNEVIRRLNMRTGTRSTAAPEGEAPERDTGGLIASVRRINPRIKGRVAFSGVQVDHPGAARLEHGATDVNGIRTLKHPFLEPSLAAMEGPITDLLTDRLS